MATHRSAADGSNQMLPMRHSRRRFAQGLAAAPIVLGAATRGISPVRAQDKVQIKFWTHTHPPMVDLEQVAIAEFMAANPDIEVQYEIIPNNEFRRPKCCPQWERAPVRTSSTWMTTRCGRSTSPAGWSRRSIRSARLRLNGRAERRIYPGRLRGRHGRRQDLRSAKRVQRHRIRDQHRGLQEVGLDPAAHPRPGTRSGPWGRSWS